VYSTGEDDWHWCRSNEPIVGISVVPPAQSAEPHIGVMTKEGDPRRMHLLTHKDGESVTEVFCQGAERFYVSSCVQIKLKMKLSVLEFFFKTWQSREMLIYPLKNSMKLIWHDGCCLKLCL
jgi:hypothetical protein